MVEEIFSKLLNYYNNRPSEASQKLENLCVCLSDSYGLTPLLIVMRFGINVIRIKTGRCMCEVFLPFQKNNRLMSIFSPLRSNTFSNCYDVWNQHTWYKGKASYVWGLFIALQFQNYGHFVSLFRSSGKRLDRFSINLDSLSVFI